MPIRRSTRRTIEQIEAEIASLRGELAERETDEANRIAGLVRASGLASLGLSNTELRKAFQQIVKSFRDRHTSSGRDGKSKSDAWPAGAHLAADGETNADVE